MYDLLKSLAVFSTIVDTGSFRAAAKKLNVSPSVVSNHVTQLEVRTSSALLYRSTRRLALTPEGESMYAAAREMVTAAERGLDQLSSRASALRGHLRIAAPAVLIRSPVSTALGEFARQHENIRLSLSFSDERVNLISDGYDVAIRMGKLKDSSLKSKRIWTTRRIVIAAAAYAQSRDEPSQPEDLEGWQWIEFAVRNPVYTFTRRGGVTRSLSFECRLAVNSAQGVVELVRMGLGIGVVPENLVSEELANGTLVEVLSGWSLGAIETYAVWHGNAPRSGLTRRLVTYLGEALRPVQQK